MALTRFAGLINAIEYAYGCSGSQVAALQVLQGSTSTGAYTILCSPPVLSTSGGKPITINTTTPITIGSDSGFETVTPTAVSTNNLNQILITATFTYAHGTGAQVSSGTVGLAEALLSATATGGLVVIDGAWSKAGGTTAMIVAATFPPNVGFFDNRYGADYSTYIYTLNNTQILAMPTTSVQLLPAPGANSYWSVAGASIASLSAGTAYAAGSVITIGYGSTVPTNALSGTIAAAVLTTSTTTELIQVNGGGLTTATAGTLVLNKGLFINSATTAFTGGTGTVQVTLNVANITT